MGKVTIFEKIKDKIKHIIYKIILPIYLWSICCQTLDEYILELKDKDNE